MTTKSSASSSKTSPLTKTRATIEIVLLFVGIPTALVTFFALFPQAWELTHQRVTNYEILRHLHAGYSIDKFTSELGEATLLTENGGLTQYTFLGDEFAVTASAKQSGAVVAFGVLACNPDFRPSFTTPGGTTITLNSAPLSQAETLTPVGEELVGMGDHTASDDVLRIARFYVPNLTRGSDNLALEPGLNSSAGSVGNPYAMGVSEACGESVVYADLDDLGPNYEPSEEARASIQAFRERVAPNFYAESVFGELQSAFYGACFVPLDDTDCARPVVGRVDLPLEFQARPTSPWWRNLWPYQ
jgi:hypothetical protein